MFEKIMSGYGELVTLAEKSGFLFTAAEVYEAHAMLLFPILFGWDALWIPDTADNVVSINHHGTASVISKNKAIDTELRSRLKDWLPHESKQTQQPA